MEEAKRARLKNEHNVKIMNDQLGRGDRFFVPSDSKLVNKIILVVKISVAIEIVISNCHEWQFIHRKLGFFFFGDFLNTSLPEGY